MAKPRNMLARFSLSRMRERAGVRAAFSLSRERERVGVRAL
jgi:hypothetical protein